MIDLIYCAAGNKKFAEIAIKNGFLYGGRLPSTLYHPIYFADQDWKNPQYEKYVEAIKVHKPKLATVIDWTDNIEYREVEKWCKSISDYVEIIIVIPKIPNTIKSIPYDINGKSIRLGYSVPTKHGKTDVDVGEFLDRDVHLLGGHPLKQMKLANILNVKSVDSNYHQKLCIARRQVFSNIRIEDDKYNKHFPQAKTFDNLERYDIYKAFDISCKNIKLGWNNIRNCFIRFGKIDDIDAINKIARLYPKELAFLSKVKIREQIEKYECLVAWNNEVVGFILYHVRKDGITTIYDIAVKNKKENIGKALILSLPKPLRLKCTIDNDANLFYQNLGFKKIAEEDGRKRKLNIWYLD